jgi:uncharacterized protein YmfQ (DUF2313 family)
MTAHSSFPQVVVRVPSTTTAITVEATPPPVVSGVAGASATAQEYGRAAVNLLPPSRLWPTRMESSLRRLLAALGARFAAVEARGSMLLAEVYPPSTVELLTDWERALGLPDECTPLGETLQVRRARVVQKLTLKASPTAERFEALAEALGYEGVTVEEGPEPLQFTVSVPAARVTYFRAGESRCGDPLAQFEAPSDLECILAKEKPAHTRLTFAYTGD